jgi:hypothetical protein
VKSPSQKPQLDKFKDAARKLETDDDEARFDEKLKRVAKATPSGPVLKAQKTKAEGQ